MSDTQLSGTEQALQRARLIVELEMERAGLPYDPDFPARVAEKLLAGDAADPEVDDVLFLMELGQGTGGDDGQGTPPPDDPELREIWRRQREGWEGHGWTGTKVRQLGREPEPRELSPGGRRANAWKADLDFMRGLLSAEARARSDYPNAGGQHGPARSVEQFIDDRLASLAYANRSKRAQTHGESGWLGALMNPEYTAGGLVTALQPFSEAAANQFQDDSPNAPQRLPSLDPNQNTATLLYDYFTKYYPEAVLTQRVRNAASAVEPTVPTRYDEEGNEDVGAGRQELQQAFDNQQPKFDDWHRRHRGEYPSYAYSSAMTLGNSLLDPTIVAFPAAGKITTGIGRALLNTGKAVRTTAPMLSRAARGYGLRLMNKTRNAARTPFMSLLRSELKEEIPTSVGLQAAFGVGSRTSDPSAFGFTDPYRINQDLPGEVRAMGPVPRLTRWFEPTSFGRTDLYIPDQRPDGSVYWRDRTEQEFSKHYETQYADHLAGRLPEKNAALLSEIERARRLAPPEGARAPDGAATRAAIEAAERAGYFK